MKLLEVHGIWLKTDFKFIKFRSNFTKLQQWRNVDISLFEKERKTHGLVLTLVEESCKVDASYVFERLIYVCCAGTVHFVRGNVSFERVIVIFAFGTSTVDEDTSQTRKNRREISNFDQRSD